ncbi:MAG: hypothetical protein ACE5JQ_12960 [Candidatus Methylomirabilales bacterium]
MRILALSLMLVVPATASAEPIQLSLLRTIQTGTVQQIKVAEIIQYAKGDEASYLDHVLARSALLVLDKDEGFPDWPVPRLLDRTLNQLQRRSHAYHLPPEMPAGFGGEDLVFTVVYALVVTGKTEEAIDVLGRHLGSGSRYKRGVVLQALRNIGNERANSLVQEVANTRDDRNLAENLLADHHYPFLGELRQHLHLIPTHQRGREELFAIAGKRCSRRATLAVYLLGFLAPSDDWRQNEAELDLLRDLTRAPCFYTRYFAIRALALRSAESIDFWMGLFDGEKDAWQRAQIARIGFARFGKTFATPALALLRGEPVQYVQWELMHGNIEVREGARFRDYWDIWQPPTLQFRLNFSEGGGRMDEQDLDELLFWLETGARPRNPWVRNQMLYGLARHVSGKQTKRYLRTFDSLPDKTSHWWILQNLADARALPLLRYWHTLESEEQQRDILLKLIVRLENQRPGSRRAARSTCCQPTRECLVSWITTLPADGHDMEITTEEQAKAWLAEVDLASLKPEILFTDPLGRVALVTRHGAEKPERWEHLYGCWRRVQTPD